LSFDVKLLQKSNEQAFVRKDKGGKDHSSVREKKTNGRLVY
jgi:hypothetical protein